MKIRRNHVLTLLFFINQIYQPKSSTMESNVKPQFVCDDEFIEIMRASTSMNFNIIISFNNEFYCLLKNELKEIIFNQIQNELLTENSLSYITTNTNGNIN